MTTTTLSGAHAPVGDTYLSRMRVVAGQRGWISAIGPKPSCGVSI